MPIAAGTINDLIRELGAKTCAAYTECFEKIGGAKLKRRGFDPKSLLVLNLELRESRFLPKGKFWLGDDGSGNYYFVEPGDRRGAVALWSHEGPGIVPTGEVLLKVLQVGKQEDAIATEAPPGGAYISRTKVPGESILDPITMDEWRRFVRKHPALKYSGARTGPNPFTGKKIRFECPGLAVGFVGARGFALQLEHGRIHVEELFGEARPLVEEIAAALGCHVMFGRLRKSKKKKKRTTVKRRSS